MTCECDVKADRVCKVHLKAFDRLAKVERECVVHWLGLDKVETDEAKTKAEGIRRGMHLAALDELKEKGVL